MPDRISTRHLHRGDPERRPADRRRRARPTQRSSTSSPAGRSTALSGSRACRVRARVRRPRPEQRGELRDPAVLPERRRRSPGWSGRCAADADAASRVIAGTQVYPGMSGAGSGAGGQRADPDRQAANPGAWGNACRSPSTTAASRCSAGSPDGFNLVVREVVESGGKRVVRSVRDLPQPERGPRQPALRRVGRQPRLATCPRRPTRRRGAARHHRRRHRRRPGGALWLILGQDGYQEGDTVQPARPSGASSTSQAGNDGTPPDSDECAGARSPPRSSAPRSPLTRQQRHLRAGADRADIFNILCIPAAAATLSDDEHAGGAGGGGDATARTGGRSCSSTSPTTCERSAK